MDVHPTVFVIGPDDSTRNTLVASLRATRLPFKEFASVESFLMSVDASNRGCVIATFDPFGAQGFDLLMQVKECRSTVPIILIANQLSIRMVVRILREGAQTVLEAPVAQDDLYFAIREAMKESESRHEKAQQLAKLRRRFAEVSLGEKQVLEKLCNGLSNREIAAALEVHVRTVEARKQRLLRKSSCESVPRLILCYQRYLDIQEKEGFSNTAFRDGVRYPTLTPGETQPIASVRLESESCGQSYSRESH